VCVWCVVGRILIYVKLIYVKDCETELIRKAGSVCVACCHLTGFGAVISLREDTFINWYKERGGYSRPGGVQRYR
jgi:hypothetical protein